MADLQKKILITGATGFIGKYIVEHALKNNFEVYIAVRKTSSIKRINAFKFHTIQVDFSSEETINASFSSDLIFDVVVHNAGVKSSSAKALFYKYNVELTKNICTVLRKRKLLKGRFVYISSLAALGPGDPKLLNDITEEQLQQPISHYGKSKLRAEKEVVSSGFPYVILRPTAVYGVGSLDYKDLINVVNRGVAVYTANPKQSLSFIHAEDVAKVIFLSLILKVENQCFNLSDGHKYTLESVYNTVSKSLNKPLKWRFQIPLFLVYSVAYVNSLIERFFKIENALNSIEKATEITAMNWTCSATKLKLKLKFKPSHTLSEIIN